MKKLIWFIFFFKVNCSSCELLDDNITVLKENPQMIIEETLCENTFENIKKFSHTVMDLCIFLYCIIIFSFTSYIYYNFIQKLRNYKNNFHINFFSYISFPIFLMVLKFVFNLLSIFLPLFSRNQIICTAIFFVLDSLSGENTQHQLFPCFGDFFLATFLSDPKEPEYDSLKKLEENNPSLLESYNIKVERLISSPRKKKSWILKTLRNHFFPNTQINFIPIQELSEKRKIVSFTKYINKESIGYCKETKNFSDLKKHYIYSENKNIKKEITKKKFKIEYKKLYLKDQKYFYDIFNYRIIVNIYYEQEKSDEKGLFIRGKHIKVPLVIYKEKLIGIINNNIYAIHGVNHKKKMMMSHYDYEIKFEKSLELAFPLWIHIILIAMCKLLKYFIVSILFTIIFMSFAEGFKRSFNYFKFSLRKILYSPNRISFIKNDFSIKMALYNDPLTISFIRISTDWIMLIIGSKKKKY